MTRTPFSLTSISTLLTLVTAQSAWAQSEQGNVFNAGEGSGGTYQFDEGANWDSGGGPPTWEDNEVDGGISFNVDDDEEYTVELGTSYSAINTLNILSRSTIFLNGTGQSLGFTENGKIQTGDGALQISGIDLHLSGNMTFDYGNGDEDNPAETITVTVGTDELAFNLIVNGAITDNGEAGINGTLTFKGGGYAMLTGGIDATGNNSSFALDLEDGSSLLLAGGAAYNLTDGVTIGYANGSESSRMQGHGILQVADNATLSTISSENSGDIELSGWGALLVGSITLNEEVEDLGFENNVATDAGGGDVVTQNLTLNDDSVVIVGDGGKITATEEDNGVLTMNGGTTFLIQDGGEVDFNELQLNNGTFINRALAKFRNDSTISGGTFTSYGTTDFQSQLTMNGTLEVLGGTFNVLKNSVFNNGSNTTLSNATMQLGTDAGSFTASFNGSLLVENGGVLTIGAPTTDNDDDIDLTVIGQAGRLVIDGDTSEMTANGDLDVQGELFVQNGGTFRYRNTHTDPMDNVLDFGSNSMIGGGNDDDGDVSTIDLTDYRGGTTQLIENVALFGGVVNNDTGDFEAGRGILLIQLYDGGGDPNERVDLDLRDDGSMIFALGYDSETETGYNTTIDVEGGQVRVGEGTTVSLSISGDEYIPTGTVWTLIMGEDIWEGGLWSDVELTGYNTITRSFEHGDEDGEVIVRSNYTGPSSGGTSLQQQRALFLEEDQTGTLGPLLHLFDQVGTTDAYLTALSAMGAHSMSAALQVTAETRTYNVFREALLEMRTTDQLGRPGPARRPLGQESQSLLASQDEGDAVRSEYGYGSSPQPGARPSDGDNMVAFVQGYGRHLKLDNKDEVVGVSGNEWGVLAGVGGKIANQAVLGVLVGYDSFSGDLNDNFGDIDVGTVRVGPFFGWSDGTWNVDVAIAGGYNDWRGTRNNPGLGTSHDWKTTGWEIDTSVGAGYRIPLGGGFDLVPEGSILYSYIHSNAYQETGGVTADRLTVQPDDLNNIIGRLGLRAQIQTIPGLAFEGRLGWQGNYTFGGRVNAEVLGAAIPGGSDHVNRNNIYYGLQVTYLPRWDIALTLRYEGRSLDGTNDQYIGGGVSFEF